MIMILFKDQNFLSMEQQYYHFCSIGNPRLVLLPQSLLLAARPCDSRRVSRGCIPSTDTLGSCVLCTCTSSLLPQLFLFNLLFLIDFFLSVIVSYHFLVDKPVQQIPITSFILKEYSFRGYPWMICFNILKIQILF